MRHKEAQTSLEFAAFDEWAEAADCKNFDKSNEQRIASISRLLRPYHKKWLELASEENCNNARVRRTRNKGYLECLEYGWLEERLQANGHYKYFVLTEQGEIALRLKPAKPSCRSVRIASAPARLAFAPPRLASSPLKQR